MKSLLKRAKHAFKIDKLFRTFAILTAFALVFGIYKSSTATSSAAQYSVSPARIGSISQTVAGSGQVSAENQLDVTSQASGAVTSIDVSIGDRVTKGQLLATIDDTTAKNSLMSSEISYAQLVEPPKPGDVENALNSLNKSYTDAMSSVRASFTDLQTVMTGVDSMLYGQSGYLGTANSAYLTTTGAQYRAVAGSSFDTAKNSYQEVLKEYSNIPANASTSTEEAFIADAYTMLTKVSTAMKDVQAAVIYISAYETQYQVSGASTAKTNVSSWLSLVNSDLSSVSSGKNSIDSNKNSYSNLITGADALQVQAAQLSLDQARQNYDNYFVRAPFDGIVGRIPVNLYAQASGGTVIATIVGTQKIANISLDEVDAAKVKAGQPVSITFDAIDGFAATGTVSQIDLVGTVSGGVVSYNARVAIGTQDDRIRPGMSLNVTITTARKDGVVIVPNTAVKKQGSRTYVQVASIQTNTAAASSTHMRAYTGNYGDMASSTASTTPRFRTGGQRSGSFQAPSLTIAATSPLQEVTVVTGISDDQNTEIVSGLNPGQMVVTKTTSASSAPQASTPSILNALGGARGGAGGNATFRAVRIGG